MKNFSVNGRKISGFCIFSKSTLDIRELQAKLCDDFLGVKLDIATEMTDGGHYIIVDATCRIENKYGIKVENGNLVIWGSYNTIKNALEYFGSEFLANIGDDVTRADNIELETEKKKIYTKEQLMQLLTDVYNDDNAIIIGQQSEEVGQEKMPSDAINKFYAASGQYPGIVGFDVSCLGLQLPDLSDADLSQAICEAVDYCSKGGIITVSAHLANPSGNYGSETPGRYKHRGFLGFEDSVEGYEKAFEMLLTKGTDLNKNFMRQLDAIADFFHDLENNGVPVIWRPFHEMNGGWFWFSYIQNGMKISAESFTAMWVYTYKYFEEERGLKNLLWNYSPNVSNTPGSVMYVYPGDEYVDMVGLDWYTSGDLELAASCKPYLTLMNETGKISAVTEFGPGGPILAKTKEEQYKLYNCQDMLATFRTLQAEGHKFTYILTWGGSWSIAHMGGGAELMAEDCILGLAEVAERFSKLK